MSVESELQQFARRAYKDFAAQVTVLLAPGNDPKNDIGTGILFRTVGGRPFLLSARHVLVREGGWKPLRMMVPGLGSTELFDVGEESFKGPYREGEDVDVAVVTLRDEFHARLFPLAATLDAVAEDDVTQPTDVVFLAGFPTYLAFPSATDSRKYLVSTLTYITGVKGRDRLGRLEVEWSAATPDPDTPPYPHLDVQPGVQMKLGSPNGISGGGLWRLGGVAAGALWAPATHAKLIGVAVAWNSIDIEYVESVRAWGAWLRDVARRIDASAPHSGP
ncbi:MAG: hypothetical protein ACLPJH_00175 [Myxococcaceae bacterium]